MLRVLFTTLSALSLLLCLVAVPIWASQGRRPRNYDFTCFDTQFTLRIEEGTTQVEVIHPSEFFSGMAMPDFYFDHSGLKLYGIHLPSPRGFNYWCKLADLWVVCILMLLPSLWAVRFLRLGKRKAPTLVCRNCGYDLRATPEQCPECGTIPNPST